jgi:apolipoprotein N-acyltransferase
MKKIFSYNISTLFLLFVLGSLTAFSFAPYKQIWTIFVAFPCLFYFLSIAHTKKKAFLYGWIFGFGQFVFGLHWISNAFMNQSVGLVWLVPIGIIGFPFVLAFFTGFMGLTYQYFFQKYLKQIDLRAIFCFACVWYFFEYLRSTILTGFPWNLMGYAFWPFESILQTTYVYGIFGLSFLTVLWASLPYFLVKAKTHFVRIGVFLFLCVTIGGAYFYGEKRLERNPIESLDYHPNVMLRLVQGNIDQDFKWAPKLAYEHLQIHKDLSKSANWENITHIIWPESAVPFTLNQDQHCRDALCDIIPSKGNLIVGGGRYDKDQFSDQFLRWNSIYVLNAMGGIEGFYDKQHLVPFGEYTPLKGILPIDKLVGGGLDFSPGHTSKVLTLKNLPPFRPLVCYEVIFQHEVMDIDNRAQWFLNVTNDGWFGNSAGPYQHLQMARIRAIENGIPLIRVANTGISAVVDPYGRMLHNLPYGERGIIDTKLPKSLSYKDVYFLLWDWFFVVIRLLIFLLCLFYWKAQKN